MRVDDLQVEPERAEYFFQSGQWVATTSNQRLQQLANDAPNKVALIDGETRLTYEQYFLKSQRLAAHFIALGLGKDDVVAVHRKRASSPTFRRALGRGVMRGHER